MSAIFVLVVVVGLAVGWIIDGESVAVAEVGEPAPDFTVDMIDGGSFTLSESRGRPVVLNFWASWCGPCRAEIPDISAFASAHPDVQVIGVSVEDSDPAARGFAAEIGATYPLALGTQHVEDAYPRLGLPATYLIDPDGVVTDIINGIVTEQSLADALG